MICLSQVVFEIILIGMILVFSVAVFSLSLCRKPDCSYFISYLSNRELNLIYFYIQCSKLADLKDFRKNSACYGQKHSIITFKKSLVHLCSLLSPVFHLCSTCVPLVFTCVHLCSFVFYLCSFVFYLCGVLD